MPRLPLVVLLLACAAALPAAVTLPIEVFGPDGTVVAVPVTVPTGVTPTKLWLRVHGLSYADKAAVQVNAGAWTVLRNDAPGLDIAEPGKRYGGIGGGFSALVLTLNLPAGAMPAGANTVRFRFERTDGRSMGWRVLAIDALDAGGRRLLAQSQFIQDDPATWVAPRPAAADRTEGERLWRNATLVNSPLSPSTLAARCSDCHAQDGRDLKYFNFTNHSIIQRSRFHGLSQTQGEQIASYIRSLPTVNPGRPWNPPFQPGPGLSQKPAQEWSAGAGLEWALDTDAASQAYVPGNATDASVFRDGPYLRDLERHDIPIAMQLLDWNHWLPLVHPKDAYGSTFTTHGAFTRYTEIRAGLEGRRGMTRQEYIDGPMLDEFDAWGVSSFGGEQGPPVAPDPWTAAHAESYYAGAVWGAAKQWELMQEFGLETMARRLYGANGRPRSWFSNRHVFNVSKHILGIPEDLAVGGIDGTRVNHFYFANVWYELQLQLNPGQRQRRKGGFHTIDWGYMNGLINDMDRFGTNRGEPLRATLFTLTSFVEHDTGIGPEGGDGAGDPWWGWNLRDASAGGLHYGESGYWDDHPAPRPVVQMAYQLWLEKNGTFTAERWYLKRGKSYAGSNTPLADYVLGTDTGEARDRNVAEGMRDDIITLRDSLGMHPALLSGYRDFAAMMWPASNWAALVPTSPSPPAAPAAPAVTPGVGRVAVAWNAVSGATSYNVHRATAAGAWLTVAFFVNGTTWTDRGLDPTVSYRYRVSANTATAIGAPSAASAASVPLRGLVAHWTFDEAAGVRAVESVDGNDGLLIEAPTRIAGARGGALRFDGQLRYVGVPRTLNRVLGGSATVAAWISTAAVGSVNLNESPALVGSDYGVRWGALDASGRIRVAVGDSGGVTSTVAVNSNTWRHVAFTRDATSGAAVVYVDGVQSGTGTTGAGEFDDRVHSLGMIEDKRVPWNGGIDDVRIYDRVLTAAEIRALATSPTNTPPTVSLTSPAAGAVTSPLTLTATAADSDGSVAKVEFFSGTTKLGEDTSVPYSFAWTNPTAGTHSLTAKATDNLGATTVSAAVVVSVTVPVVPSGWSGGDVGAPALAGSASGSGGSFTVIGAGSDIWGASDQFHFVHRRLAGDGEIVARVDSLTNTNPWAKAGVMIRESMAAGSRHVLVAATALNGVAFQRRVTTNGSSSHTAGRRAAPPIWVKLRRVGSSFTASQSVDGVTWTVIGSATVAMTADVEIGLAVTSHAPTARATATFSNVTVTGAFPGSG